jgi:hypothetical protein
MHLPAALNRWFRWVTVVCMFLAALGPGMARGDELTRQVQEELRKRNLFFGDIDGRYTPQLAAALRRYQERKGFAPTGQPGEDTLRSLALTAPAAASGAKLPVNEVRDASPPAAFLPWPDVPVLKSDLGRRHAIEGGVETERAIVTPTPPPAAASPARRITPEEGRAFVERYLRAGQANDPEAEVAFYADRVDYFDEGIVDRRFIEKDVRRYNQRWPERQFTLVDPVEVSAPDENAHTTVEFRYQFAVKGRKFSVRGIIGVVYTLAGNPPEALRIVRVREYRVRQ